MDISWDYRQKEPPRLLDRMREEIRKRHYSRRTEEAYLAWTARFLRFRGNRHPLEVEKTDVEEFLSHLATEKRVAASTQNQALSAVLFFFEHVLGRNLPWINDVVRAKKPRRLPVVLTRQEIQTILLHLHGMKWLAAMLMYGQALRPPEGELDDYVSVAGETRRIALFKTKFLGVAVTVDTGCFH